MSPRSKKKSSSTIGRGGGKYRAGMLRNSFVTAQDQILGAEMELSGKQASSGNGHSKFTLLEEGRNTERRHNFRVSDSRLRHSPINFRSAGEFESSKEMNTKLVHEQMDDEQSNDPSGDSKNLKSELAADNPQQAYMTVASGEEELANQEGNLNKSETVTRELESRHPEAQDDHPLFFVDIEGSKAQIKTGFNAPKIPPPSPTLSHSSQEVVLFTGRPKKTGPQKEKRTASAHYPSATYSPEDVNGKSMNGKGDDGLSSSSQSEHSFTSGVKLIDDPPVISLDVVMTEATVEVKVPTPPVGNGAAQTQARNRRNRYKRAATRAAQANARAKEAEDEILADYVENMREHGEGDVIDKETSSEHDLAGEEFGTNGDGQATIPNISASADVTAKDGWASSDLQDFENLSTSDEVLGSIQRILAKRTRPDGLQYLIVWEGQTTDDARWILSSSLTMAGAVQHIQEFEERRQNRENLAKALGADLEDSTDPSGSEWKPDSDDESDESDEEKDSDEEEERIKDNEDLLQRKIERMSDEKIARLLSKQEELGMGSDELLLFDDDGEEEGYDADDNDILGEDETFRFTATLGEHWPKHKRNKRALAACASNGDYFDVMDRDRPSIQKKAKGHGAALPFELSDPELEANLRTAWEKDRTKKSIRKREREELRAQALLGKKKKGKKGPINYNRYSDTIDITQIKNVIKELLFSTNDMLSLPPMDKRDRKVVHELANAFRLKSKSEGTGPSRYTILRKTQSTGTFNQRTFEAAEASLHQRSFFIRMAKVSSNKKHTQNKTSGSGSNKYSAVSYRDGDVVGAAAPELGADNKGRAMLEKMGWSTGTALGALDNKGILHPVAHIVKTSKAGLG